MIKQYSLSRDPKSNRQGSPKLYQWSDQEAESVHRDLNSKLQDSPKSQWWTDQTAQLSRRPQRATDKAHVSLGDEMLSKMFMVECAQNSPLSLRATLEYCKHCRQNISRVCPDMQQVFIQHSDVWPHNSKGNAGIHHLGFTVLKHQPYNSTCILCLVANGGIIKRMSFLARWQWHGCGSVYKYTVLVNPNQTYVSVMAIKWTHLKIVGNMRIVEMTAMRSNCVKL